MAFRLAKRGGSLPENPEVLFRDLRNRSVEGLLAQQADMLRRYIDFKDKPDVALQMPTGSGKTLVGLLIAEWRRRVKSEQVLFLCPTRQLVNQVVEQAKEKYGINCLAFTGRQRDYPLSSRTEYENAEAVAVSTYSGLFNVNPFFDNPKLVILDDAHAADNYLSDFWSLLIEKRNKEHAALFDAIAGAIKLHLSLHDYSRMCAETEDDGDRSWTNKLPAPTYYEINDSLYSILETHCAAGINLSYKWKILREHLRACQFFYARGRILIKPLISPTDCHLPFSQAVQRVYMSATFGEGGDLERIVGKRVIAKIPAPEGWDKQGIGRRLFFFPMRSLSESECEELLTKMAKRVDRTLVLTPSEREANEYREVFKEGLPNYKLFDADSIEESKRDFVRTRNAVAIVSNRYDGIDLVQDECRLMVVSGLPRGTNLQELFLMNRLGAKLLYNDRIRTRIVQATGRCTRSATDYAAVVVLGEHLNKYLIQNETRRYFHPELQAEVDFGIEESKSRSQSDFLSNLELFLERGQEWNEVEEHILEERDLLTQASLPCADAFLASAPHEVGYQYALWDNDYVRALDEARKVLAKLDGPEALRGYRAFWLYLAGNAAHLNSLSSISGMEALAREYYTRAAKAAKGITWLYKLASVSSLTDGDAELDQALDVVVENIEVVLERLGTIHDRDFEGHVKVILEGNNTTDAKAFERSQVFLGELLGFDSNNSDGNSAPDTWWVISENQGIVFEDYTDCEIGAVISTKKVRQALSHPTWLADNPAYRNIRFDVVLLTSATELDKGARPLAKECFYWQLEDYRRWVLEAVSVIREVRSKFVGIGDLAWRSQAKEVLIQRNLSPAAVRDAACARRLADL